MTERLNFRMLVERVRALEAEVEELKKLAAVELTRHEQRSAEASGDRFSLKQRGRWWYCVSPEGTKLNETGLSKEDAQALADDMNGVTKVMADA